MSGNEPASTGFPPAHWFDPEPESEFPPRHWSAPSDELAEPLPGGEWPPRHWVEPSDEPPADALPHALAPAPVPPAEPEPPIAPTWPPPHWVDAEPDLTDLAPSLADMQRAGAADPLARPGQTDEPATWPPAEWGAQIQELHAAQEQEPAEQEAASASWPPSRWFPEMQRIDTDAKAAEFEAAASEAADMSDEELAAAQARSEVLRRQKLANDRADLEVRRQEAIAEDVADREKALAQLEQKFAGLEQKWQELGQQKIDTGRWWSNRSTGQKAAAYIAAAIHGFMNPGEPNPALAMMERAIDRDIAAQRADLETGRASLEGEGNLVAKFARLTGDIGEAAQAAKIAALDAAEREVTHRAAAFDPAGTAAREAERAARAIRAAKAEALAKMKAEQIEALQKLAEERRKEREFQEDQRQAREREKIARWKAAIDSRAQKQREKEFDAEFGLKERDRDLAEAKLAEQGTLYNPLTSKPMATVRGLYADDPKAMKDLQERVSGHAMLIESMDELGRLVDDAGGRFDIDEPTLRAKANAILTDLSMAKAKILSGADATDDQIERIKKTFGGVKGLLSMDLSDPNAVLNQTRRRSHRELELKLKGAGVKIGRDRNTGKYTGEMAEFFNDLEAKAPTAGMPETARAKRMARMPKPQAESMAGQHMRQKAAKDALAGVYGSFSEKQSRPGEADVTPELEALQEIGSDTSVDPEIRADAQRKAYSILELTGDQKKGLEWLRDLDARVISDDKMNELIREYNDLVRSTESEKTMGLVEELK